MKDVFKTCVADFLGDLEARGYASRTIRDYRTDLKRFLGFVEEKEFESWSEVSRSELVSYAQSLLLPQACRRSKKGEKRVLSGSYRNRHLSTVRSFFKFLVKTGVLLSNPATELGSFRLEKKLPQVPNYEDVLRLMAACDVGCPEGLRDRLALELFYSCGIRFAELLRLNLENVCLREKTIHVMCGKNGKDRLLPLLSEPERLLCEYLERGRPVLAGGIRLVRKDSKERGSQALFLSATGGRLCRTVLRERLKLANKKAGLKKAIKPHMLRHACATHLLKRKVSLRHIQVLLGHKSLSTTQLYTLVELSDLQDVVRRHHPRESFEGDI